MTHCSQKLGGVRGVTWGFLLVIALLVALIPLAYYQGKVDGLYSAWMTREIVNPPISVDKAIELIERSQYSHQHYVDHPELLNPIRVDYIGDLEFQRAAVSQYQAVIDVLKSLKEDKAWQTNMHPAMSQ